MLYGFNDQEWAGLSATKKQLVRNWALEKVRATGLVNYSLCVKLLTTDVVRFDSEVGHFEATKYNSGARKIFSNTSTALINNEYGETASKQLADLQQAQNSKEREAARRTLESLREGANNSYSGCDIIPSITIGSKTFVLGNISTLSYSIHRAKIPVRTLGHTYPKGFVSAGRSIAGSLIFTIFDRHALRDAITAAISETDPANPMKSPLSDQLPPFDIGINFNNEYGSISYMRIYGVEISDEGQTHSINDIYSENVMQYVARDIDLMTYLGDEWTPQSLAYTNTYNLFMADKKQSDLNNLKAEKARLNLLLTDIEKKIPNTTDADILNILNNDKKIVLAKLAKIEGQIKGLEQLIREEQSSNMNQSQTNSSFTSEADSPYALDRPKFH